MPPMSSIRSFITALKTGQTPTTRALERIAADRTEPMRAALQRAGALNRPLSAVFRGALRTDIDDLAITQCIDNWPDEHKERVRIALVDAVRDGRPVRFRWGLTAASDYETFIDDPGYGPVTFTARTPQAQLSVYDGDQVNVPPVDRDAVRAAAAAAERTAKTAPGTAPTRASASRKGARRGAAPGRSQRRSPSRATKARTSAPRRTTRASRRPASATRRKAAAKSRR